MIKTPKEYINMEYRWLLIELAKTFHPHTYVEIGVKKGYTFNAMLPYVKRAVGVDIVDAPIDTKFSNWEFFKMPSSEFAFKWKDPINFLFIDGDHNRDAVLDDFERLFKFVQSDEGLIFLHDTYPVKPELCKKGYCYNAWEAAKYLRKHVNNHPLSINYEIITLPGPWAGLSIIRKLSKGIGGMINHGPHESWGV